MLSGICFKILQKIKVVGRAGCSSYYPLHLCMFENVNIKFKRKGGREGERSFLKLNSILPPSVLPPVSPCSALRGQRIGSHRCPVSI